jgi:cellulose synthase operon protein C
MIKGFRLVLPVLMLVAALVLSGCESSEDRAEGYYQSALTLMAEGDVDGALVELRNVFKYNGFHKEARQLYADTQLARGETAEAYSQYLRLIEQYPDTIQVRQTLAEIAMTRSDWDEVERHGEALLKLAPDLPGSRAIRAALDYRKAVLARDDAGRAKAAAVARTVLTDMPDNPVARRIVIDSLMNGPTPQDAMPQIDAALAKEPMALELHGMKLQLLAKQNDLVGTGIHLQQMVTLFPDNKQIRDALITWYINQKDFDGAEIFLRKLAGADTGPSEGHVAVVQLLQVAKGLNAAKAELDRLIAANTDPVNVQLYTALRAAIVFESGGKDEAITIMEGLLADAEPSDQTHRLKVMLAQMLLGINNQVGARARIEEILAEDATNSEALKLRAAWLIQEDKPGEAIVDLRAAISQNPRDPAILTLMAEAHERDGSPDLAAERLAMAVEVSNNAPGESLRYAAFLRKQGRDQVAETVLVDARQSNPGNIAVLIQLADIWLAANNFTGVQNIVDSLRTINTPEANEPARQLQAALLLGQNRAEDGLAFLQSQIDETSGSDARAIAMMVETQVRSGKVEEARRTLDDAIKKAPDDQNLTLLSASLYALAGDVPKAEAAFRTVIAANPTNEAPIPLLYRLLVSSDRTADATAVLDTALLTLPKSFILRWMKAGELERAGNIDATIAVYEALYAEDSSNIVVANNLASLITTHRDDQVSLDRAFTIARRLRGSSEPAFQDTYGWIESRRGNLAEALPYLEPAAAGLPNDALTQYHLGMTYAGLGRADDARTALTRALEIAGDSPLPQFQMARDTLAKLPAATIP